MKILAVAPHVPHPGVLHAGGSHLLHHLEELHHLGHEITLLIPGDPTELRAVPSAPPWLEVVAGPDQSRRTRPQVVADALYRRVMAAPPGPSAESLRSVVASGLLDRARDADVVELHWAEYARLTLLLRRAGIRTPVCVVEHDVDLEHVRERVRRFTRGYRRWLGLLSAPVVRALERRGLTRSDLIAVFTSADEAVVRRAGIDTPVFVVDPWLDPVVGYEVARTRWRVLFTGALWRKENEESIVWFIEQVWPAVPQAVPGALLQVVGAGASAHLREVAGRATAVEVVGEVPDLVPYYFRASVFVAPLLARGGLKFKVPQAMLCGLPVVATPAGAEGVVEVAPEGTLWTVTGSPARMREDLVAALLDESAAAAVGDAAARWASSHYSFARSVCRLSEVYERLLADRTP